MAEQKLKLRSYEGGISTTGGRKAKPFSAKFIKNLNPFEDPSYLTLSKAPTKISGSTVTDLIYWGVEGSPYSQTKFFLGSSGKVYWENSAGGSMSNFWTSTDAAGEGLAVFNNWLYIITDTDIDRYGHLTDSTPSTYATVDVWWGSNTVDDLEDTGGGTGATDYVPPTSLSSSATDRQTWTISHDPIKTIQITVNTVGTGDWTLTLKDPEGNTVATKTITNANMSTGVVNFTFSTPARVVMTNSYYFQVTSTVADGGVATNVNSDLEGAWYRVFYAPLISAEFHPVVVVSDKLIIGNEQYLATFDEATYSPNEILLERGFKARSITRQNEFIVVSAYRGDSIDTAEESRNFYWDTISPSWNYYTDTTSLGAANALTNAGNMLRGVYGNSGGLYDGDSPAQKRFEKIPKLAKGKKLNIYPSAIAHLDGITLIGVSGSTDDSTGLEQGIYAYGSENSAIGEALVLLYTISTGTTQGATVQIGWIGVFGDDIYYSWRDGASYGVDKIAISASAVSSGVYESLIFDNGDADKSKLFIQQVTTFEPLASGETVTNKQKTERASSFTTGTTQSTVGSRRTKDIFNKRFKELEAGFTVASSNGTFPKITQHEILFNDNQEEGFNE